ncbi:glycosyltransferase family 2 protein, partial [Halorubrum sp. SS5]
MTGGSVVESNPTVGAVIVNYRSEEETHRLTAELYEGVDELVIVDNSSPSATLDQLARSTERVSYLESDGNVGYAAGNNLGIQ